MPEERKIIDGSLTLDRIEETIATKEAWHNRFVRNEPGEHEGRPANHVTFENGGLGLSPKRLALTMIAPAFGAPPPEWQGDMVVQGKVVKVWAYRSR